jgi:Protein of unknown function, DUF600
MFKTSLEIFQKVCDIVVAQVSEDWKEISVEAEIDDQIADLCVWYIDDVGSEKYFDITNDLTSCFVQLRALTGDPDKGFWTKCLFTLSSTGKFKTDFSYDPPRWSR